MSCICMLKVLQGAVRCDKEDGVDCGQGQQKRVDGGQVDMLRGSRTRREEDDLQQTEWGGPPNLKGTRTGKH